MKSQYFFIACLALAVCTSSCSEKGIFPGDNEHNQASIEDIPVMPDPMPAIPDPETAEIPEGTMTVQEIFDNVFDTLTTGKTTDSTYTFKGWISSVVIDMTSEAFRDKYNNAYIYIGKNPSSARKYSIYGYRVKGPGNKGLGSIDSVKVGDFVVVKSKIQNYNGICETSGNATIEWSSNELWHPETAATKRSDSDDN